MNPPNLFDVRAQVQNYLERTRGDNRHVIEMYASALLAEHGKWLRRTVDDFGIEAVSTTDTRDFEPYGDSWIAGEVF